MTTPSGVRALAFVRGAWGAACLVAPRRIGRAAGVGPGDRRAIIAVRVLGLRETAQAVLVGTARSPEVSAVGVWVDLVHALSMVALAGGSARYRRPALASAATAVLWGVLGSPAGPAGRRDCSGGALMH
jgi:hypothetical protein